MRPAKKKKCSRSHLARAVRSSSVGTPGGEVNRDLYSILYPWRNESSSAGFTGDPLGVYINPRDKCGRMDVKEVMMCIV